MRYSKGKAHATNQIIVISIACLSIIISLLFQLLSGAYAWGESLQSQMKVYVYLDDSLQTSQIDSTIFELRKRPQIIKESVQLTTKESIAKEFLDTSHENYEALLGDVNPFKNLLILQFQPEYRNKSTFEKISKELSVTPGIYEVSYPNNYLDLIIPKIKVITSASIILIALLAFIVYFQISNYTKLHIHANRTLIKSMQLLGSTNTFIMRPYLLKSVILGLIGSFFGYLLTNLFYLFLNNEIPELTIFLFSLSNQSILLVGSITIAVIFSFTSTLMTLNKYLKITASNLY